MKKLPHIKKFFKFTLKHYSMNDNIKKNNDYTIFNNYDKITKNNFSFSNKSISQIRLKTKMKELPSENENHGRLIHFNSIIRLYNDNFNKKRKKLKEIKTNFNSFNDSVLRQKNLINFNNSQLIKNENKEKQLLKINKNLSLSNIEKAIFFKKRKFILGNNNEKIFEKLKKEYSFFEIKNIEKKKKENKLKKLFTKIPIEIRHSENISKHQLKLMKIKSEKEIEKVLNSSQPI